MRIIPLLALMVLGVLLVSVWRFAGPSVSGGTPGSDDVAGATGELVGGTGRRTTQIPGTDGDRETIESSIRIVDAQTGVGVEGAVLGFFNRRHELWGTATADLAGVVEPPPDAPFTGLVAVAPGYSYSPSEVGVRELMLHRAAPFTVRVVNVPPGLYTQYSFETELHYQTLGDVDEWPSLVYQEALPVERVPLLGSTREFEAPFQGHGYAMLYGRHTATGISVQWMRQEFHPDEPEMVFDLAGWGVWKPSRNWLALTLVLPIALDEDGWVEVTMEAPVPEDGLWKLVETNGYASREDRSRLSAGQGSIVARFAELPEGEYRVRVKVDAPGWTACYYEMVYPVIQTAGGVTKTLVPPEGPTGSVQVEVAPRVRSGGLPEVFRRGEKGVYRGAQGPESVLIRSLGDFRAQVSWLPPGTYEIEWGASARVDIVPGVNPRIDIR